MTDIQCFERLSAKIARLEQDGFGFATKNVSYRMKNNFRRPGIRFLTWYDKDKTLLVSNVHNGQVQLLNLLSGKLRHFKSHFRTVRRVKVVDEEIITASWDGSVRISNYYTLEERLKLRCLKMGRCPDFSLTPDGNFLFSFSYDQDVDPANSYNNVRQWCLKTGTLHNIFPASSCKTGTSFSGSSIYHNNRLYVASDSGFYRAFSLETGSLIAELRFNTDFRTMIGLPHYNCMLACDWEGNIYLLNMLTHQPDMKVKAHSHDIYCLREHPLRKGNIFTADKFGMVNIWEMPGLRYVNTIDTGMVDVWSMDFLNNRLLVGGNGGKIMVYDIIDLNRIKYIGSLLIGHDSFVAQVEGSNRYFTNDTSLIEIVNLADNSILEGKEAEYLAGEFNSLKVLRELFGVEDYTNELLNGEMEFIPMLQESFG
jgi:WD40 repeat protein